MRTLNTLAKIVTSLVSPKMLAISQAMKDIAYRRPNRVNLNWYPQLNSGNISPDVLVGGLHAFTLNGNVNLPIPTIPDDWDAIEMNLYLRCVRAGGSTVSLGTGLTYIGGDGLILPNGSIYLLTLEVGKLVGNNENDNPLMGTVKTKRLS